MELKIKGKIYGWECGVLFRYNDLQQYRRTIPNTI